MVFFIYIGGGPRAMTGSAVLFIASLFLNGNFFEKLFGWGDAGWHYHRPPTTKYSGWWSHALWAFLAGVVAFALVLCGLMRYPPIAQHWVIRQARRACSAAWQRAQRLANELLESLLDNGAPAGRRGRGRDRATKEQVNALPMEDFVSEAELRQWSPARLKEVLRKLHREAEFRMVFSGGSESRDVQRLLRGGAAVEKDELVRAVVTARGGESGLTCAVCISAYDSGSKLRVLPCGHRFHCECVDQWLTGQSKTCPLCSKRI